MTRNETAENDTERFVIPLWGMAPEKWVTPDDRKSHRVASAEIVGEPGLEDVVIEIERYQDTDTNQPREADSDV